MKSPQALPQGWSSAVSVLNARLFRERGKHRQFINVARIVLDDDLPLQIRCDLLHAIDRSYRLRAIEIEPGHAVRIVILAEVDRIAGDDDGADLCKLYQQAGMITEPSPNTSLSMACGSTFGIGVEDFAASEHTG